MHRIQSPFRAATVFSAAFGAIVVFVAAQGGLSRASGVKVSGPAIEISVTTDRAAYAPDESIAMRLNVTHRADTSVVFHFSDGQRYDFPIQDEAGETRWRWSADKSFIQVLGEEHLAPGDTLTYQEHFEGPLSSGTYAVVGALVATNFPLVARAAIAVR